MVETNKVVIKMQFNLSLKTFHFLKVREQISIYKTNYSIKYTYTTDLKFAYKCKHETRLEGWKGIGGDG